MIVRAYEQLNNSFRKELIYKVGTNAGFFSEYNNMILAMLFCLEHKIKFKLCAGPTNFHLQEGWNGFFLPFCPQVTDDKKHYKTSNWKYALKLIVRDKRMDAWKDLYPYFSFGKTQLRTQDVFGRSRDPYRAKRNYYIPELGIEGDIQHACSKLIEITWHYNSTTQKAIDQFKNSVNLPEKYIGFHIRGGDKFVEHKLEPITAYFSQVKNTAIKTGFVLTDDYAVIKEIHQSYPEWDISTFCQKEEHGFFFRDFSSLPTNQQQKQFLRLFASIDLLAQSEQFIGTFSSNPGMYLGMRNASICTGVDFNSWKLW